MSGFDEALAEAGAHHKAGRLAEAEAAYREALGVLPGRPSVMLNLAVVIAARGDHAGALAVLDDLVAAEPDYAAAHFNRGVALDALGRQRQALDALRIAARLDPGHYDAHRWLGFLWLAEGDRDRALDHFARTYELRRGEDRGALAVGSLTRANRVKLAHDAALFRHLAARLRDGKRFEMLARVYDRVRAGVGEEARALSEDELEQLGEDYNTAIHVRSAPEVPGGAISAGLDAGRITEAFVANGCAAIIDEVLSPAALAGLRRYLTESTIWHDFEHIAGFVATYLEDGLACPLVLQIADELRGRLPGILGPHPLTQAWAFKGIEPAATVAAHADDAAVSLNFWMTPEGANAAPDQGGLAICLVPPPEGHEIEGYEEDALRIAAFLDAHPDRTLKVPYGYNRGALFRSRLFHRSDNPRFGEGYEPRRINVTLLFGRNGA